VALRRKGRCCSGGTVVDEREAGNAVRNPSAGAMTGSMTSNNRTTAAFVRPEDEQRYVAAGCRTTDITLPVLLRRVATRAPDRLAVWKTPAPDHIRAVAAASRLFAAALGARGLRNGDVVGVQLSNRVEAIVPALGVQIGRRVVCPTAASGKSREVRAGGSSW
jgi:non-ribosomal peptide synthetase component E (peptide arylation enzyme)